MDRQVFVGGNPGKITTIRPSNTLKCTACIATRSNTRTVADKHFTLSSSAHLGAKMFQVCHFLPCRWKRVSSDEDHGNTW